MAGEFNPFMLGLNESATAGVDPSVIMGFMMIFFLIIFVIGIISYVFFSWAMMTTAKRMKTGSPWLAWIPVANFVLKAKMAKMHWWPMISFAAGLAVFFIGGLFMAFQLATVGMILFILGGIALLVFCVFSVIWDWKICVARKRPGWWALLPLVALGLYIPVTPLNWIFYGIGAVWPFVMWGVLAWSKK